MGVLDGSGREPPVLHLTVKVLYVSGCELSKLDAPESRDYVAPYLSLVRSVCAGPDASPDAIVEPPFHELPNAHVLVIEDEPAVPVGYGSSQLLPDLFAALAVDVASFPACSGFYPVLADPVAVFAAVDRALVIAAPLRHAYSSPFISSRGSTPRAVASLWMVEARAGASAHGRPPRLEICTPCTRGTVRHAGACLDRTLGAT